MWFVQCAAAWGSSDLWISSLVNCDFLYQCALIISSVVISSFTVCMCECDLMFFAAASHIDAIKYIYWEADSCLYYVGSRISFYLISRSSWIPSSETSIMYTAHYVLQGSQACNALCIKHSSQLSLLSLCEREMWLASSSHNMKMSIWLIFLPEDEFTI